MIIDEAKIFVKAGDGGDGGIYFRHEKYIEKGGPDGGDGGDGGSVRLISSRHIDDLTEFARKRSFAAVDGGDGMRQKMYGKKGSDLVLNLPLGTQVFEDDKFLIDMTEEGQELLIAKGGSGGWGNHHFATSIKQTPKWAKKGLAGESKNLRFELKMIADVGLVGLPNAGKSTLLSVISNAKPKIADYPFTTLEPNLGAIRTKDRTIVVADIPGLIEGASKGRGLGDKFLKHIERTKTILHLITADSEDPIKDYKVIEGELTQFSNILAEKKKLIVLTKSELVDSPRISEIKAEFKKKKLKLIEVSAVTHHNIDKLVYDIAEFIK